MNDRPELSYGTTTKAINQSNCHISFTIRYMEPLYRASCVTVLRS